MTSILLFLARNWRSSKKKKLETGGERKTKKEERKNRKEKEAKAMKEKSSGKE